jgi:hypothetical protein
MRGETTGANIDGLVLSCTTILILFFFYIIPYIYLLYDYYYDFIMMTFLLFLPGIGIYPILIIIIISGDSTRRC